MYSAKDMNGNRVEIEEAILEPNEKYLCVLCDSELVIKNGNINRRHFAHKVLNNCDSFSTDMSEWHRNWQKQFPVENREVIIENKNVKHRADICVNNNIIEFQHSSISQREFDARNHFYTSAGYKVIWIFDFIEEYENNNMVRYDEWDNEMDEGGKFNWKNPRRFMKNWNPKRDKNVVIIFQLSEAIHNSEDEKNVMQDEESYFEKIIWVINDGEGSTFRKFFTSYSVIDIENVKKMVSFKRKIEPNEYCVNKIKLNHGLSSGINIVKRSTILKWQNNNSIHWKTFIWYMTDYFKIYDFGDDWIKLYVKSYDQSNFFYKIAIQYHPEMEDNYRIDVKNEMWRDHKRGAKYNSAILFRLID